MGWDRPGQAARSAVINTLLHVVTGRTTPSLELSLSDYTFKFDLIL